jgi:hypothetical protein
MHAHAMGRAARDTYRETLLQTPIIQPQAVGPNSITSFDRSMLGYVTAHRAEPPNDW